MSIISLDGASLTPLSKISEYFECLLIGFFLFPSVLPIFKGIIEVLIFETFSE